MRLTQKKRKLLGRSAAALMALSGGSLGAAHAQTADTTQNATEKTEVVIVTARRREETLQDVPVSVTAFTADQLSKQGIPDVTALATSLPNTTLKSSRATNSTLTAFIRGVGQQDPVAGYESGVGIYLDDVYMARPQGAVADIYDVERIEVLRGPQGTLYGRNTIGGAVKYVTRKLAPQTDVRLRATIGDFGQRDGVLSGSTPLSDAARIGASVARFTRDGFGKNLFTGAPNYDKDVTAARLTAEFMPSTSLFIRLSGDVTQDDSHPKNGHRLVVGVASKAPVLPYVFDTRAGLTSVAGHKQWIRQSGGSALVEWQASNELTFKSVTAYRKDTSYAPIDFDALPTVDFDVPAIYKNKQFSQEFQLTYTGPTVQGVAGIYYMKANAFNQFDAILNIGPGFSTYTMADIDTKAVAVFADGSYNLTDALSVSLGGRYTVDERDASILRKNYLGLKGSAELGNPGAVFLSTDTNLTNGELQRKDKKFTPRIALSWKATADQNVYATLSEGFMGGGFDPRLNLVGTKIPVAVAKQGYRPSIIDTFELGLKSQFAKGRLMTNLALFYSKFKDVQIPASVAIDTNGDGKDDSFAGTTSNAGRANLKGIELEAMAKLTNDFTVSAMYSYIDAKYTEFLTTTFVAGVPTSVDISSQRVFQNTPKNSASLRVNYDIPMPLMGRAGKLTLIGSGAYKSAIRQFEFVTPLDEGAYTLWDASVVWTRADGKVRAGLHGKNLRNVLYRTGGYNYPTLGTETTVTTFYGNPRTVSGTLEYRF